MMMQLKYLTTKLLNYYKVSEGNFNILTTSVNDNLKIFSVFILVNFKI